MKKKSIYQNIYLSNIRVPKYIKQKLSDIKETNSNK